MPILSKVITDETLNAALTLVNAIYTENNTGSYSFEEWASLGNDLFAFLQTAFVSDGDTHKIKSIAQGCAQAYNAAFHATADAIKQSEMRHCISHAYEETASYFKKENSAESQHYRAWVRQDQLAMAEYEQRKHKAESTQGEEPAAKKAKFTGTSLFPAASSSAAASSHLTDSKAAELEAQISALRTQLASSQKSEAYFKGQSCEMNEAIKTLKNALSDAKKFAEAQSKTATYHLDTATALYKTVHEEKAQVQSLTNLCQQWWIYAGSLQERIDQMTAEANPPAPSFS